MNEHTFTAASWVEIKGRGWAAVIPWSVSEDLRHLLGQQVTIDGKVYTVKGVERIYGRGHSLLVSGR